MENEKEPITVLCVINGEACYLTEYRDKIEINICGPNPKKIVTQWYRRETLGKTLNKCAVTLGGLVANNIQCVRGLSMLFNKFEKALRNEWLERSK